MQYKNVEINNGKARWKLDRTSFLCKNEKEEKRDRLPVTTAVDHLIPPTRSGPTRICRMTLLYEISAVTWMGLDYATGKPETKWGVEH